MMPSAEVLMSVFICAKFKVDALDVKNKHWKIQECNISSMISKNASF